MTVQGSYETGVNRRKLYLPQISGESRESLPENEVSAHGDFWASYPALRHIFTSKNMQKLHWEQI